MKQLKTAIRIQIHVFEIEENCIEENLIQPMTYAIVNVKLPSLRTYIYIYILFLANIVSHKLAQYVLNFS